MIYPACSLTVHVSCISGGDFDDLVLHYELSKKGFTMNKTLLKLLQGEESKYPKYIEEHYPNIIEKLLEYWGTPLMYQYFDELMMSKRPGRQGFPPEATLEIWALNSLYESMHPNNEKGLGTNVWLKDEKTVREEWKRSFKRSEDNKS